MKKPIRGLCAAIFVVTVCSALLTAINADAAEVVLYSAGQPSMHKDLIAGFNKKHPDIEVKIVEGSTGTMVKRVIAEKANPQADVIFTINTIQVANLKDAGVLEPYAPKDSPVPMDERDPDGFWTPHYAGVYGLAVNTERLAAEKLSMPKTWLDLIDPAYKGHITIAAPTKSGTGLVIFSTLVDAYGWNYVDNLHQNIFAYTSSGSAPARKAASGEVVIGLTFDSAIKKQLDASQPIEMVLLELLPNVARVGGLVAGGPNPKEGKLYMDFLFSEVGAKILSPHGGVTSVPGYGWLGKKGFEALNLWKMRRPVDSDAFKREWAKRYEK